MSVYDIYDSFPDPEIDAEIAECERLEDLARTQAALEAKREDIMRQEAEYRHYLLTNSNGE